LFEAEVGKPPYAFKLAFAVDSAGKDGDDFKYDGAGFGVLWLGFHEDEG
jgi:hypothetical protein